MNAATTSPKAHRFNPWVAILGVVAVFAAGGLGSAFTMPSIQEGWYGTLTKPPLQPPNYLFGIVWPILYILISVSFVMVYRAKPERLSVIAVPFGLQVTLNALWSIVFFGARFPVGGLVVILALIASIVWMFDQFRKSSPLAAWLLLPYLLWVSFATYLNAGIVFLNR